MDVTRNFLIGNDMKMNVELITKILLEIEKDDGRYRNTTAITIEGFSDCEINFHVHIMSDEGLLDAENMSHANSEYEVFWIKRMTSYGHEYLGMSRDEKNLKRGLDYIKEKGEPITLSIVSQVLTGFTKQALGL